jgi:hypothetical protein
VLARSPAPGGRAEAICSHLVSTSSVLNESGHWYPDAIERQLAHVEPDAARRAYARPDYWDVRVRMMSWWADKCEELRYGDELILFPSSAVS